MNKIILIGNLTMDPELKKVNGDLSTCSFRIAVQRRFANQNGVREADFFNILTWRQTAELCARYLFKGRKCGVVGSLHTRTFEGRDGAKRTVIEIVADEVEFLSSPQTDNPVLPISAQNFNNSTTAPSSNGFIEVSVDDEDLPF